MQTAREKRKLEALVIAKGGSLSTCFFPVHSPSVAQCIYIPSLRAHFWPSVVSSPNVRFADTLRFEGEQIYVLPTTQAGKKNFLSDADARDWAALVSEGPPPEAGSDVLAGMMGEKTEE